MVEITSPRLVITQGREHRPGTRYLHIDFDVRVAHDDPHAGRVITEQVTVHGVDVHDAPMRSTTSAVLEHRSAFTAATPLVHRHIEQAVVRADLDVAGDWWATSNEGEPMPIAEWLDHLVAEIVLLDDGAVLCRASSPIVTGSWGALGHD